MSGGGLVKKSDVASLDTDFSLEGKKVDIEKVEEVKPEDPEEYFENRVLPPIPDYMYHGEYKDLALSIRREIINDNPNVRFKDIIGL